MKLEGWRWYGLEEILDSERISDEIIGFHSQQAVEKLLKAVLSEFGVAYIKVHDLEKLLNLLADNKIEVPDDIKELICFLLTPLSSYMIYYLRNKKVLLIEIMLVSS
ncbi:MAG: HEPN domain-containing protein [Halobacteriota archaeon]|nr:HEPN domain-containing protein [Halobacteriota archaeon]